MAENLGLPRHGSKPSPEPTNRYANLAAIWLTGWGLSARWEVQQSQATAAKKHVILTLVANPHDAGRLTLDREARAIHVELQRGGYLDRFGSTS